MSSYEIIPVVLAILLGSLLSTISYIIIEAFRVRWDIKKRIKIMKIERLYSIKLSNFEEILTLLWNLHYFVINSCDEFTDILSDDIPKDKHKIIRRELIKKFQDNVHLYQKELKNKIKSNIYIYINDYKEINNKLDDIDNIIKQYINFINSTGPNTRKVKYVRVARKCNNRIEKEIFSLGKRFYNIINDIEKEIKGM